jgi:hypothetical protein
VAFLTLSLSNLVGSSSANVSISAVGVAIRVPGPEPEPETLDVLSIVPSVDEMCSSRPSSVKDILVRERFKELEADKLVESPPLCTLPVFCFDVALPRVASFHATSERRTWTSDSKLCLCSFCSKSPTSPVAEASARAVVVSEGGRLD